MRLVGIFTISAILTASIFSQTKVGKDHFPTGPSSPEGVACDLARAFINRDSKLFLAITVKDGNDEYKKFLRDVCKGMDKEKNKSKPSPGGPRQIVTCYVARHLSKDGPNSAAHALFDLNDVKFVDVKVKLVNGEIQLNRTLVVQDKHHRWFVHPRPDLASTLSYGLNDETASSQEWKAPTQ